jgi:nitrous oxidase accessory protein
VKTQAGPGLFLAAMLSWGANLALGCVAVAPGTALQPLLDKAGPGSVFCLSAGEYAGPLVLGPGVALEGSAGTVIRSNGQGNTLSLIGEGARVSGLTIEGSGRRYDKADGAVYVHGDRAQVLDLKIRRALFGVFVEKSRAVTVRGNSIEGDPSEPLGLRGDAIHLWESSGCVVAGNTISDVRDLVAWYSPDNRIEGNTVRRSRYGTHFMFSHGNLATGNRYLGNVVGIFCMYSRNLSITANVIAESSGAAGMGLGLKECGNLFVQGNAFVKNRTGLYVDVSPFDPADRDLFKANVFALCQTGVLFHSSQKGNTFESNSFRGNLSQVAVDGGGDALDTAWHGNHFDDYAGYDLDGDGFGDVPYQSRRLSSDLISDHPQLEFLRGSPALSLMDAASQMVPLFEVRTVVRDPRPAMASLAGRLP